MGDHHTGMVGRCARATGMPATPACVVPLQAAPDAQLSDLKTLLGRMLFTGLAVNKKVSGCTLRAGQRWCSG